MRFTLIQVGDNPDLDITQDGQNNKVGTDPVDMTLSGDDMTFAITQTGNTNSIRNPKVQTILVLGHLQVIPNAVDLQCSVQQQENVTL